MHDRMIWYRFRWLVLAVLMLFTCWCAITCRPISPSVTEVNPKDCHWVEHVAGVTCIPNTIQRLVTLDSVSFEYAVALGFHPVGSPLSQRLQSYLNDQLLGVENIGVGGNPSLERVLALKPDLILGLAYHQGIYTQASQIAPTILMQFDHSGEWKAVFQKFSTALKREEFAQQVMNQYHHRLQDLQHILKTAANPIQGLPFPLKVSVVRIYPHTINLYLRDSFCGTILQDAGLARPLFQNLSASEAKQQLGNEIQVSISVEQTDLADGDVMFIWTSEDTVADTQTARKKLATLQSSPLWQSLNVIKRDRVYFVPDYWIGAGPLAAQAVIDDLFKYLVKSS